MITRWFTFGQSHCHRLNGFTYDCDTVVQITSEDPRDVMHKWFGNKWAMEYEECPDMSYYPRGLKEVVV